MKKITTTTISTVFLLLHYSCSETKKGAQKRKAKNSPLEVRVFKAQSSKISVKNKFTAIVKAKKSAPIIPEISGIIHKRYFKQGSFVEKGEPLYLIQPDEVEANVEKAKAQKKQAQASLKSSKALLSKYKELAGLEAVSEQEFLEAQVNVEKSQSAIELAKAQIKQARVKLEDSKVPAPISGYIGKTQFTEGQLVGPNMQTPLATINSIKEVYVDINLSINDLEGFLIKDLKNQDVFIYLDKESEALRGHIVSIEREVDPQTASVQVRSLVSNPEEKLFPGMFVEAHLAPISFQDGILVPQKAVSFNQSGSPIVWISKDNSLEKRTVKLGEMVDKYWLIKEGISPGTLIVNSNFLKLKKEGTKLNISKIEDLNLEENQSYSE